MITLVSRNGWSVTTGIKLYVVIDCNPGKCPDGHEGLCSQTALSVSALLTDNAKCEYAVPLDNVMCGALLIDNAKCEYTVPLDTVMCECFVDG